MINFRETNQPSSPLTLKDLNREDFFIHEDELFRRVTDTGTFTTLGIECLDMSLLDVCYLPQESHVEKVKLSEVLVEVTYDRS